MRSSVHLAPSDAGSAAHTWLQSFADAAEEIETQSVKSVDELREQRRLTMNAVRTGECLEHTTQWKNNMSEHHVTVVRIGAVERHPNADTLSITRIFGGYPVILRTGDYAEGDLAVYIPVDATVPGDDPRWSFLANPTTPSAKPIRIRAKKLRGIFSMGLLAKVKPGFVEGQDVAEILKIGKWEPAIDRQTGGDNEPDPGFMPVYTDIEGLRRHQNLIGSDEWVSCTEKIHGANGRFLWRDGRLWCGSRTGIKREDASSIWWQAATAPVLANAASLMDRLQRIPDIAVYGEVYGQVQDLRYGVPSGVRFAAFDMLDTRTRKYLNSDTFRNLAMLNDIPLVPELYRGPWSGAPEGLAEGISLLAKGACIREGYVVRPLMERHDDRVGRVILKFVGEGYHLRKSV